MLISLKDYIDKNGQLRVPKSVLDISKVKTDRQKRTIMRLIDQAIDSGRLTFDRSFLKHLTLDDTRNAILSLYDLKAADLIKSRCNTCAVRSTYDARFVSLLVVLRHNLWYNRASDIFQRHDRMRVEVAGFSPYKLWKDPERMSLWLYKLGHFMGKPSQVTLCSYMLRKCMMHRPYATQFPPFTAKAVYTFLGATKVLDPCFGWGDRFAAAYCTHSVQHFHGIDPRQGASKAFLLQRQQYNEWLPHRKLTTMFTQGRAEKTDLKAKAFDTIFTSPPFFDKEKYKSIGSFASLDAWFKKFLEPMIDNVWRALAAKGHLAIHLEDDPKRPISNAMNMYIGSHEGAVYKGIICMPKNERPGIKERGDNNEPIWVWQKA